MIGKSLDHYEITAQLGVGGMGEVYRARDTKLGREVAIKLLPEEVARDPERIARFRREAKLLASLNHPNIAALYGLEEAEGRVFLVMEIAEGQDLSQRLLSGAIPVDEGLELARQIAEGLEEAHAKGIVHRDLKPANVMLSSNGRIKLLDFGLARAYHGDTEEGDPAKSPTITAAMTQQGVILGTAAYMSPEQTRGKTVDKQSDIWAFGVLLYEMFTGQRLFAGETISDSIGAILHKEPDWTQLPPRTPPQVLQLLHRCLERERERRLRDIGDARVALDEARRDPTGSSMGLSGVQGAAPQAARTPWLPVLAAGLVALAVGIFLGPRLFGPVDELPYRKLDLGVELVATASQSDGTRVVISPDGEEVAFVHDGRIWMQSLDELEARVFEGSDDAFSPFWSPDGNELGWFQNGKLWKAPARGGRAVAICEIADRVAGGVGANWGDDGRIVFSAGSGAIYSVSALGGQPQVIVPLAKGQGDLHEPFPLPDGKGILHVVHPDSVGPGLMALYRDGESRILYDAGAESRIHFPVYDGKKYILFRLTRGEVTEGLWAMEFELGSGEARGEPFLVEPDASAGSVSRDGTIVFVSNPQRASEFVINRIDMDGRVRETLVPARSGELNFEVSPTGDRICFTADARDGGAHEVWVRDLTRGTEMRLASSTDPTFVPFWSADETEIFFSRAVISEGKVSTWRVPSDGSGPAVRLASGLGMTVSPDGSSLLMIRSTGEAFLSFNRADTTDIWLLPIDEPESEILLKQGPSTQYVDGISPDGEYLLYASSVSGQFTLYLTRFPSMQGRWQVSADGNAGIPCFSRDGSIIYYESEGTVYAVDFQSGPSPVLGKPRSVLTMPEGTQDELQVDGSGEGFLVVMSAEDEGKDSSGPNRQGIKIVQNWTAGIH